MRALQVALAVLLVVFAAPLAQAKSYELCPVRVIELDSEQMKVSGNSGWWLQDHLPAMIREAASSRRDVIIAVSERQFNEITDSQDRITKSGRYRQSSVKLNAPGQMISAGEHFSISVLAVVERRNEGGLVKGIARLVGLRDISADIERVNARCEIVLEPINIGTGLNTRGIRVVAGASENSRMNIDLPGRHIDYDNSGSNAEDRLLRRAAEKAVKDLVSRLSGESRVKPIPIGISSGRQPQIGDQVYFFVKSHAHSGDEIAVYEIVSVDSKRLGVRTLMEKSRPTAENPFRIIN